MINGAHVVIYTSDAEADRAFFRDVLGLPSVDAGRGWLIFQAPPAEIAFHPTSSVHSHELMLMCEDLMGTMAELQAKGVEFTRPVEQLAWGLLTGLRLPGGGDLALYEPSHPRANG